MANDWYDTRSLLNDHILGITWYSDGCEFIRWRELVTTHRNISWNPTYLFNNWNLFTESPIVFRFPDNDNEHMVVWSVSRGCLLVHGTLFVFFSSPILDCYPVFNFLTRSSKIKSFVTYWWSRRKHHSLSLYIRLPVIPFQVDFMLLFGDFFW